MNDPVLARAAAIVFVGSDGSELGRVPLRRSGEPIPPPAAVPQHQVDAAHAIRIIDCAGEVLLEATVERAAVQ